MTVPATIRVTIPATVPRTVTGMKRAKFSSEAKDEPKGILHWGRKRQEELAVCQIRGRSGRAGIRDDVLRKLEAERLEE